MTKRLVNVGLQLHVERSCDDVTSQDAFGSIESSLSDVFQAAVKLPSSPPDSGNRGTSEGSPLLDPCIDSLTHRDLALYRAC
jgi:hypothetical protein